MGLTHESLSEYDADVILVAPCGMGLKRATVDAEKMWRHSWWRELRAVKDGQVRLGRQEVCTGGVHIRNVLSLFDKARSRGFQPALHVCPE